MKCFYEQVWNENRGVRDIYPWVLASRVTVEYCVLHAVVATG